MSDFTLDARQAAALRRELAAQLARIAALERDLAAVTRERDGAMECARSKHKWVDDYEGDPAVPGGTRSYRACVRCGTDDRDRWERINAQADLTASQARVAELEAALAQFALIAEVADDNVRWAITHGGKVWAITNKHLQHARTALRGPEAPHE